MPPLPNLTGLLLANLALIALLAVGLFAVLARARARAAQHPAYRRASAAQRKSMPVLATR